MSWFFYALASALFAALTAILGKIGVLGVDSNVATAVRSVVMAVAILGLVFSTGRGSQLFDLSSKTFIFVVLSALAGAASWLAYFRALQIGEASKVAPIDRLSLVITVILAFLILKEELTWTKIVGSVLMVGGAMLMIH